MLSLHLKLEDLYPEKCSDKEEVALLLIGIKMLKDLKSRFAAATWAANRTYWRFCILPCILGGIRPERRKSRVTE